MSGYVIDTNIPIVANGRTESRTGRVPSIDCRIACIEFLSRVLVSGRIVVDLAGAIQAEYRRYLNPSGQPGVGDRFYQAVLTSAPRLIERIALPKSDAGEYVDLPLALVDAAFDPADRKFAALARRANVPVANATDGDWLEHRATLEGCGIPIVFVCGRDPSNWFVSAGGPLPPEGGKKKVARSAG